jgi:hypothetical protein
MLNTTLKSFMLFSLQKSFGIDYPAEITQEELISKLDELNAGNLI